MPPAIPDHANAVGAEFAKVALRRRRWIHFGVLLRIEEKSRMTEGQI
jgi:hypothetical protein